ncbi:hypothetical protein C8F01DRAFT_1250469 [Mycena amicta]|nr:hypothetical protein C8F01DRAFT_1250469 [Mycena amicta]
MHRRHGIPQTAAKGPSAYLPPVSSTLTNGVDGSLVSSPPNRPPIPTLLISRRALWRGIAEAPWTHLGRTAYRPRHQGRGRVGFLLVSAPGLWGLLSGTQTTCEAYRYSACLPLKASRGLITSSCALAAIRGRNTEDLQMWRITTALSSPRSYPAPQSPFPARAHHVHSQRWLYIRPIPSSLGNNVKRRTVPFTPVSSSDAVEPQTTPACPSALQHPYSQTLTPTPSSPVLKLDLLPQGPAKPHHLVREPRPP